MLDTSAPGHFSTCVRHFGTKTNRHPDNSAPQLDKSAPQKDKSALVFFSLILRTKLLIALNQFQILIMFVPEKIPIMPILILIHNLYDVMLICPVTELSWCRTVFFNGAEMSWCRTVFFNGCRTVLFPYDCIKLTPVIA